ncbi:unnamed protein product [Ambrosiozyma monospora]|uniref:Unnamed protein product n=1 Tax=Ambrosiozyma monospora TaxID=43982 RepID=A0ACB5U2K0_AMBMO|nr:unnamed protein product [Ambrosiozyma monospora]
MAGDSFFTDPSKKRKNRSNRQTSTVHQNAKKRKVQPRKSSTEDNNNDSEESVSDIDEEEVASDIFDSDSDAQKDEDDVDEGDDEEEYKTESAADKRRRLAKQYLQNLQQETETYDFDAKDLDNDIIASRLQQDVAEQKGYIYKFIGEKLLLKEAQPKTSRMKAIANGTSLMPSLSQREQNT